MSLDLLGEVIDLHTGGIDLRFPHHEDERAQSNCAVGAGEVVRHWVHGEHLLFEGRKMAKSTGNVVLVTDVVGARPRPARAAPGVPVLALPPAGQPVVGRHRRRRAHARPLADGGRGVGGVALGAAGAGLGRRGARGVRGRPRHPAGAAGAAPAREGRRTSATARSSRPSRGPTGCSGSTSCGSSGRRRPRWRCPPARHELLTGPRGGAVGQGLRRLRPPARRAGAPSAWRSRTPPPARSGPSADAAPAGLDLRNIPRSLVRQIFR